MIIIEGIAEIQNMLQKLSNINLKNLDKKRGKKYVSFLEDALRENKLNLTPIKQATVNKRLANLGGPLYDTGETARTATVKEIADNVEAGFFRGDKTIRGKIDAASLMIIHAEGREPLLPKRDWLSESEEQFTDIDDMLIDDYLDDFFKEL